MAVELPPPVRARVDTWLALHDRLAPGVVEGLYVLGSAALGDWRPDSDIDVVAFVADPTDGDVVAALESAHRAAVADGGGPVVDGPFLSWADVTSPPLSVQRAWSLDGEFRFDGECFEINPVTWFTLAVHGVPLRGPAPDQLDMYLDADDRGAFARENVDTYWRGLWNDITTALVSDPGRREFTASTFVWAALGIARMAYTFATGDVTSKSSAGEWAADRYPVHASVFREAVAIRRSGDARPVARPAVERLVGLLADLVGHIAGR